MYEASGREEDKVKKGDKVRFELDFDEADGVIRFFVNDLDRGIAFTGEGTAAATWLRY